MNQAFSSPNNEYHPLYNMQALPFSSTYVNMPTSPPLYHSNQNNASTLPTIKEPPTPSSPTYIPILTRRLDWCPWSKALMMVVMGMNLFGHLMEHYDPQWGYDPGSIPMYAPVIIPNSSPGLYGGSEMDKCITFSSHACQHQHVVNFLELVALDLSGALYDLCIRSLSNSLEAPAFRLLQSLVTN